MKRYGMIVAGALVATAGAAFAGLGTTQFGLPQGWSMTNTTGYGARTGINGNPGSAMCVECHTVNPSDRILQVSQGGTGLTVTRTNAAHRGSHFVMNVQAGGGTNPWGITHSGGGYTGGWGNSAKGGPRDAGQYFRNAAWTSTGQSKYNVGTTLSSAYEVTNSVPDTGSDLICESCHNLVINTANAAPDNDLLLGVYQDSVDDALCLGCHAQREPTGGAGGVKADYDVFSGNDNLLSFSGTARKRHHVMTGQTLDSAGYGTTGMSSVMWAPSASNRLDLGWCGTGKYSTITNPSVSLDLSTNPVIAFRNACNAAGSGTRVYSAVAALGDIGPASASRVNCSNCHRPHNAMSSSGAYIFRMGDNAMGDFAGKTGTGTFSGTTNTNIMYGLRRQADVDTAYGTKTFGEYRPLCAGCHQGY